MKKSVLRSVALVATVVLLFCVPALAQTTWRTLLNGVSTGTSSEYQRSQATLFAFAVEWSSGVTGGVVVLEESTNQGFGGTWHVLATTGPTFPPPGSGPSEEMFHLEPGLFGVLRARIDTPIAGGTVTVRIRGLP